MSFGGICYITKALRIAPSPSQPFDLTTTSGSLADKCYLLDDTQGARLVPVDSYRVVYVLEVEAKGV